MKNQKSINIFEVYKPPFTTDGIYIWSSNNVMALMDVSGLENSEDMMFRLADILNDKDKPKSNNQEYRYNGPDIIIGDRVMFVVRGWGHLIGAGGLNLSQEVAAKIQYQFASWVISKLKGL